MSNKRALVIVPLAVAAALALILSCNSQDN